MLRGASVRIKETSLKAEGRRRSSLGLENMPGPLQHTASFIRRAFGEDEGGAGYAEELEELSLRKKIQKRVGKAAVRAAGAVKGVLPFPKPKPRRRERKQSAIGKRLSTMWNRASTVISHAYQQEQELLHSLENITFGVRQQFIQLSSDLATIRWSWTGYIPLEDVNWIDLEPVHAGNESSGRGRRTSGHSGLTSSSSTEGRDDSRRSREEKEVKREWRMVVHYGPPWRHQQIELFFGSGKEAYRWARGLEALVRATALPLETKLKHYLMEMFNQADLDNSNTISNRELPNLLSFLNFGADDRWKALEQVHLPLDAVDDAASAAKRTTRPVVIRFADFYKVYAAWMFGEHDVQAQYLHDLYGGGGDFACTLYEKYASSSSRIGLERAQFIRMWREEVDLHGQPPPQPVITMFDQMAAYRKKLLALDFAHGTSKRAQLLGMKGSRSSSIIAKQKSEGGELSHRSSLSDMLPPSWPPAAASSGDIEAGRPASPLDPAEASPQRSKRRSRISFGGFLRRRSSTSNKSSGSSSSTLLDSAAEQAAAGSPVTLHEEEVGVDERLLRRVLLSTRTTRSSSCITLNTRHTRTLWTYRIHAITSTRRITHTARAGSCRARLMSICTAKYC